MTDAMSDLYYLDGQTPRLAPNIETWAKALERMDRRVAETFVGKVRVSTVFIGLDHQFGNGPPLLFETMVFGGEFDDWQERCSTWEQALAQHERTVKMIEP